MSLITFRNNKSRDTADPTTERFANGNQTNGPSTRQSFVTFLLRGNGNDAAWSHPAFIALLVVTAAFYFYNLTAGGYGNDFYAAAVQAGTKSWKAFLFGSADWSNSITVDKTPASLWPMEIFGRFFGFSSWSMLAPNVLEGVGSVALVYAAIKRWFGPAAGLLAGATLAITPVAALMFRFNNPDAALTFLLVAAAYCTTRAIDSARARWMLLAGVCIGFGFLAKELQAMLVVPALGVAYLVAAPTTLRKRIAHLLAGLVAMIAGAGWWLAIASLWSSASRPFFGGSAHNSILEVILGGNGLDRITGGSGGAGRGGANFSGAAGWGRLFNSLVGGQISWLIPAALIALVAGLALTFRTNRTNKARAALILWGSWFIVTALTLSFMQGVVHPYYTVALAPAIAAIIGIVVPRLWQARDALLNRSTLVAVIAATGAWSYLLLDRTPTWQPWLRFALVLLCAIAAGALVIESTIKRFVPRVGLAIGLIGLTGSLLGPAAFAAETVSTSHSGSLPSAGPSTGNAMGFGGPGGDPAFMGQRPNFGNGNSNNLGFPGAPPLNSSGTQGPPGFGGLGGTNANSVSSTLVKLLQTQSSKYKWAAATVSSQASAPLQLATNVAVMDIGGFTGSDPSPTLAQFESYVAKGEIHYFIAESGGMGGRGGDSGITSWVASHFKAETVGGQTVYDLTTPTSVAE